MISEGFYISSIDYVLIIGLISVGTYFIFKKNKTKNNLDETVLNGLNTASSQQRQTDTGFISKMKSHGRNVIIFYGSQTGTAEEFASRLAKESVCYGLKAMVTDPEECDLAELEQMKEIENSIAIFCMATYGEGDPTDNAHEFYDWLTNTSVDLSGLNYAVFGLGNKTYEHFNKIGISVDSYLEKLGATRIHPLGLGDDDTNIEKDFLSWKESFWASVCLKFNLSSSNFDINLKQYKLHIHEKDELNENQIYKGEILRLNGYLNQKLPFDAKNPFLAPIMVNKELYKGERSCMHIELNIENSKIKYEAGDHVGIYPTNNEQLVEKIGELLDVELNTIFTLKNIDEDSSKKHPFPCPCSYRTALRHYVDITSIPRTHVLKDLAEFANEEEKKFLLSMTFSTEESRDLYSSWVVKNARSIIHILEDLPSVKIPLDHLLELLPRLNVRYYSISSSFKVNPKSIHLTAVYVEYTTPTNRLVKGVTTRWLKTKLVEPTDEKVSEELLNNLDDKYFGAKFTVKNSLNHENFYSVINSFKCPQIPIFVRKSQFKLPVKPETPIIMIGPGTGLAPFRGFLQERKYLRRKYFDRKHGNNILYYGCRKAKEDYLYEEELKEFLEEKILTKLYVAFSRDQEKKIYVTHLLKQNKDEIWDVIRNNGHIYICGDAKAMDKDVHEIILQVIKEKGNKTQKDAEHFFKQMLLQRRYSSDVWS